MYLFKPIAVNWMKFENYNNQIFKKVKTNYKQKSIWN